MRTCFFIGHRETSRQILPSIIEAAEGLILEEQVSDFYAGGYGCFDQLAGEAIIKLKKDYPNIRLFLVLPYHPANRPVHVPPGYDDTFYPDGMEHVYPKYAIATANRKMIDKCDFLIAYARHTASNAYHFFEYAMRQEKKGRIHIENLAEKERAQKREDAVK